MPRTISYTETLEVTRCYCGIALAAPSNLVQNARDDPSVVIYCPLGHKFGWHESEADRLRKQLADEERRSSSLLARVDQEKASHAHTKGRLTATKGQLTKTRKRVANGVCPCCNRSFVQLTRHMKTQHPDYAPPAGEQS